MFNLFLCPQVDAVAPNFRNVAGQREGNDLGQFGEQRVDSAAQVADTFAVDDPHLLCYSLLLTCSEIIRDDTFHVGRAEGVQIQHAVNGQLDRVRFAILEIIRMHSMNSISIGGEANDMHKPSIRETVKRTFESTKLVAADTRRIPRCEVGPRAIVGSEHGQPCPRVPEVLVRTSRKRLPRDMHTRRIGIMSLQGPSPCAVPFPKHDPKDSYLIMTSVQRATKRLFSLAEASVGLRFRPLREAGASCKAVKKST